MGGGRVNKNSLPAGPLQCLVNSSDVRIVIMRLAELCCGPRLHLGDRTPPEKGGGCILRTDPVGEHEALVVFPKAVSPLLSPTGPGPHGG